MNKTKLYLDIDGVIYGWYGNQWQIRPYTATLINWAKKHFEVKWLSFNSSYDIIGKVLYSEIPKTDMSPSIGDAKLEKLRGILNECDINDEWLIIEDSPPTLEAYKILEKTNNLHKWLVVPSGGADTLLEVKLVLENYLVTGEIVTPVFWSRFLSLGLSCVERYRGMSEAQCEKH